MSPSNDTHQRVTEWRETNARLYLTAILWVMPVLLLVWTVSRPPPRFDLPFAFITLGWLSFVAVRLFAPRSFHAPLVVALLLLVALTGPFALGLSAGPFLSGVSAVILAGAVYGRRAGFRLLAITVVALPLQGALISLGVAPTPSMSIVDPTVFPNWVRIGLMFVLTTGALLFVLTGLLERLELAWRDTEAAAARERQEQLQRQQAEARALEAQRLEAIGRLAGGVAHDFNNLLVIIMSWTDLLQTSTDEAEKKEGFAAMRQASTQAAQLTRQLLSFARKDVTRPGPIDLESVVTTQLKSLRRLLPDDVTVEATAVAAPPALADAGQVAQVLINLAMNAADAMPRGGTITLRTELLAAPLPPEAPDPSGRYVALSVTDTGEGMDEATRLRVFEPFFTTKAHGRGTGLGLATVYGIATQAKGFVQVVSSPGRGSTFLVAFPVAPEGATVAKALEAPEVTPAARGRILLVEDDAAVRDTMAGALRRVGYELTVAANADEALVLARRHQAEFDLLCTDGVMPGLPTHVLIDGFRQLFPQAHVLVCSGHVEEELVRRGISEGAMEALPKPFTGEALVARVQALLARR